MIEVIGYFKILKKNCKPYKMMKKKCFVIFQAVILTVSLVKKN